MSGRLQKARDNEALGTEFNSVPNNRDILVKLELFDYHNDRECE